MSFAIRIAAHGGPEVLRGEDLKVMPPGAGEVLLRHTAIGRQLRIDVYERARVYMRAPVAIVGLGREAAGVIESAWTWRKRLCRWRSRCLYVERRGRLCGAARCTGRAIDQTSWRQFPTRLQRHAC